MKKNSFHKAFERLYYPVRYHLKRYPKAGKKRRILKKWVNRFGEDSLTIFLKDNPFLKMLPKEENGGFSGKNLSVPIIFGVTTECDGSSQIPHL